MASYQSMAGAIILRLAYGYTPKETGDYFVELSEECLIIFLAAHEPTQPVNVFPIGVSHFVVAGVSTHGDSALSS